MTRMSKKVCLIGDFAVGKTSLVRRFIYDMFDDKYLSTIGVKVSRKSVYLPRITGLGQAPITELAMMLWDLAGSEEFTQVRASYLRGTAGAVLVCDLTRPETLDSLPDYMNDLFSVSPGAQIILAANKDDLVDQRQVEQAQLESVAAKLGVPYYLTSAKTGTQVESLFNHLGQLLIDAGAQASAT